MITTTAVPTNAHAFNVSIPLTVSIGIAGQAEVTANFAPLAETLITGSPRWSIPLRSILVANCEG